MSDLAARLALLSPEKRALLGRRLRQAGSEFNSFPLSFAQERLWFGSQLAAANPFYNVYTALHLTGTLRRGALTAALAEIVRRHEALRTVFPAVEGRPVQVVQPARPLPVAQVDLAALPPAAAAAEMRRRAGEEIRRPFELAAGPLLRATLIDLGRGAHVLLVVMHHILCDGWSAGILVQELSALYRAGAAGLPSPLAELPIQYVDFAQWQRRSLAGEQLHSQLAYWRDRLREPPPPLRLRGDRPRPAAAKGWAAGREPVAVGADLGLRLGRLGRDAGATSFMTLLAAFLVLLWRHSGQTDLVIGTPIANRNRAELEPLIGFFVNTLPLRVDLGGDPSCRRLLDRVREAALGAYAHQDLPFEKLVEDLKLPRQPGESPLFQVLFGLQNAPRPALVLAGLELRVLDLGHHVAEFDLAADLWPVPEGLAGVFDYLRECYDATTVRRMAGHYLALLEGIASAPRQRLGQLDLLSRAERQQLAVEWSGAGSPAAGETTVPALFEALAARRPEAIAVIAVSGVDAGSAMNAGSERSAGSAGVGARGEPPRWLTYGELNLRANRLAHRLHVLGVGPEVAVAVAGERSPEMVIAWLAVLKAGGAYVPLDPAHPREQLAAVLRQTRASVLVVHTGDDPGLARLAPCRVVAMAEAEPAGRQEAGNPVPSAAAANLACIVQTSGWGGPPRAVGVSHRGICRLAASGAGMVFEPHDRVAQTAGTAGDTAAFEVWGALLNGGSLLLVAGEPVAAPQRFAAALEQLDCTVLCLTSSRFHQLASLAPRVFRRLRCLLVGGEPVDPRWMRRVLADHPPRRLLHGYGTTESAGLTTCRLVAEVAAGAVRVPIGAPLANHVIHVLDAGGQPAPIGAPGELYAGGDGLARGYGERPDLTAERFLPDPFGGMPGCRLLRTGDLARRLPDGGLELLGRSERQIEIRGHRVEPGEIAAVLAEHPGISQCVVLARQDPGGERQLVAYLVAEPRLAAAGERAAAAGSIGPPDEEGGEPRDGGAPALASALRRLARRRLPPHGVPTAFVLLPALPLLPNGKLDLRALPPPADGRGDPGVAAAPPRTPHEQALAAIWREVLGIEEIGAEDDFFVLGGHSLLAAQVVSRIHSLLGVELPLRALFEHPTLAALAESLESGGGAPPAPSAAASAVRRLPRDGDLPLSFAQERLWFLHQLQPSSPAYNEFAGMRFDGPLDARALLASCNQIVRRHEALRTLFAMRGGGPVQVILPVLELSMPVVDLTRLHPARQPAELRRVATERARQPFNLARGPLERLALVRLEAGASVALFVFHHIVFDGWSAGVFLRELAELYPACRLGRPSPLPDLACQYADFALWQRAWLRGEALESRLAYWRRQLAGLPVVEMPTDRPRPAVQSFRGERLPVVLPPALGLALRRLSRSSGTTLFMTLLAAFQTLLHRYSGQSEVVVGSPVANRGRDELEGLIGFFVNTLVLRADCAGAATFAGLLAQVRETALDAYAHQDVPFEKLVEELQPVRNLGRNPLFDAFFQLHAIGPEPPSPTGLEMSWWDFDAGTAKFDLNLALTATAESWIGSLEYCSDLFARATAARMLGHFVNLLESLAARPARRLAELSLLGPAERQQLLVEWRVTADRGHRRGVLESFRLQVRMRPQAVALTALGSGGRDSWTYGALAARAGLLARHLRLLGVGPEVRVGVLAERAPERVAALLAVLAVGGVYVPLDPFHPPQRLLFILADARVAVLVGRKEATAALGWRDGPEVDWEIRREPADPPRDEAAAAGAEAAAEAAAESLAYVIYTSGSTGAAKGVALPLRALDSLLRWQPAELPGAARTLQFAAPAFDVSLQEDLATLCSGGELVVIPEEVRRDPERLLRLIGEEGVERIFLPMVALQALAAAGSRDTAAACALRDVVAAGEALRITPPVADWLARMPGCRLHNHYGPSESHVVTTLRLEGASRDWPLLPAIGRPVPGARIDVLDAGLEPVPIGVVGEIAIGGPQIARGYLARPRLTAERFVPDPHAGAPGERLYRTGDLARRRTDGSLELLGRGDRQIKVHGMRVEPAEIEAVLERQPGVSQAVVEAREDGTGDRRLVAYLVSDQRPEPGAAELRSALRSQLPEPMVPAAWVFLERLPLTASGKIDRQALPAPAAAAGAAGGELIAPRDAMEEMLAAIWCGLLERPEVSVDDDFFALGGHSLLATQLVSRIRDACGCELPLQRVFEAPTLAAMAEAVRAGGGISAAPPLVPQPGLRERPLSFAQQRLWFLDRLVPANPFYNMFQAFDLEGAVTMSAFAAALREIVRRHEALRTVFREDRGAPVQVVVAPGLRVPRLDLAALPAAVATAEVARLSGLEAARPFDLSRGPVLRAQLLRLAAHRHVLLLNVHHIAGDGWSMGVFARELVALYQAFASGAPSPLPELPIQYGDFAVWQRRWLQGEALAFRLGYWRRHLAAAPAVLELPCDRPRPAIERFRGSIARLTMPAALVARLRALARIQGATLYMVLLAGFKALLARYAGQPRIVVGSAVANRRRSETEELIGFFVNVLVMHTDLAGDPGFGDLVGRVREVALGAFAHQDLPFEKLVEELQVERDLGRNPLCQVLFTFQNFPRPKAEIPGLAVTPSSASTADTGTAKFDLTLFGAEAGDEVDFTFEYSTDLFDAATVARLLCHLESVLRAGAAEPQRRLADLPLLGPAERHHLLVEWNDTAAAAALPRSLDQLLAAQAARTPAAPALRFAGREVAYGELEAAAGRLARRLRRQGVGPEVLVGIALPRSPLMVVAVLGALKAGGAFLPLDPGHPRERLRRMLSDARPAVVLTLERLAGVFTAISCGGEVWCLDADREADGEVDSETGPGAPGARRAADPDQLAYVLYTSGSTGSPKGVAVSHRGLVNYLTWCCDAYAVAAGGGSLLQSPLVFDLALTALFAPLLAGRPVELLPESATVQELAATLRDRRDLSLVKLTPAHLELLLQEPAAAQTAGAARALVLGGESLPAEAVAGWRRLAGPMDVFNEYGPTEAVVGCCVYRLPADAEPGAGVPAPGPVPSLVPIGRPIANTRLYLLDGALWPVPSGAVGELYIGGDGLARGYLGRPELTAQSFLPDPFGGRPGGRLYRSGDLARWLPNGLLTCLGRVDNQVKIRGHRVELGEVEAALAAHPGVRSAAVTAREDLPGDRRLAAYVVADPAYRSAAGGAGEGELERQQVADWQAVFAAAYRHQPAGRVLDFAGWNSSSTRLPIPEEEMREWVHHAVEAILGLAPRRVLEIGCGTGLILLHVAPRCAAYVGTDISAEALAGLRQKLGALPQAKLALCPAERSLELAPDAVDTIVLNSVVQYFPSVEYLVRVLEAAVGAVAPGGSVFLGDVRSLALLTAFYTAMELELAPSGLPLAELRRRIAARREEEQELVVEPGFFLALGGYLPRISRVEIRPKRGRSPNELTLFRYDVVLRVEHEAVAEPAIAWLDWQGRRPGREEIGELLRHEAPDALGLSGVADSRLAMAAAAAALVAAGEGIETAGQLRERLAAADLAGLAPDDVHDLVAGLPYEVELRLSPAGRLGCYDVVLRRRGAPVERTAAAGSSAAVAPAPAALAAVAPVAAAEGGVDDGRTRFSRYANQPLRRRLARRVVEELPGFLRERLPAAMIPTSVTALPEMPLLPSGKVDRRQLPHPDPGSRRAETAAVAPRDRLELALTRIWEQVLGMGAVGVHDNFFALGGHSLSAVKLMARIESELGHELPLSTLFQHPTVEALAGLLRTTGGAAAASPLVALQQAGSKRPFFWVHPAGGNVLCYVELARCMGEGQPVYGLQSAGLEDDSSLGASLDDLAAAYVLAIRTVQPRGPYQLGGWSQGGVIALEMARHLAAQGEDVALLALLDSRRPQVGAAAGPPDERALTAAFARDLIAPRLDGIPPLPSTTAELCQLSPDEQLASLIEVAVRCGILPPDAGPRRLRRLLEVFKANFSSYLRYQPGIVQQRIHLFRAREEDDAGDPTYGWGELALVPVSVHEVGGNHYSMLDRAHAGLLAARLRACMEA
jgi:amino acid adenylation domain-containing protein